MNRRTFFGAAVGAVTCQPQTLAIAESGFVATALSRLPKWAYLLSMKQEPVVESGVTVGGITTMVFRIKPESKRSMTEWLRYAFKGKGGSFTNAAIHDADGGIAEYEFKATVIG